MSDFYPESAAGKAGQGGLSGNVPEFSVSEISMAVKRTLEGTFERVRVRGEISGFKRAASGHLYMALKDENAVLDAVCWRGTAGKLSGKPEDGMEVVCTGKLTTYPGRVRHFSRPIRRTLIGLRLLIVLLLVVFFPELATTLV